MKKKQTKNTVSKKEEAVLTRDEFFKVLDRVIQPIPSKEKSPKTEKKGTSE
jgi:hypothetical protein